MQEKNQGITLIALIITIIIMLILVAVSISLALNSGLFEKAGKAAQDWKTAQEAEGELGAGKVNIGGKEYASIDDYFAGKEIIKEVHNWQYTDNTMSAVKCECAECKKMNAAGVTYSIGQEIAYTAGPSGTKWVVFGIENCNESETNTTNETLLITTLEPSEETLYLEGADAYNNGIAKIEAKVKEIYGNEARAMKIEDVNRTLGYTPAGGMYYDENYSLQTTGNFTTKLKDLGATWTSIIECNTNDIDGVFYTPAHPEGISDNGAELGEYLLDGYDYYYYEVPESTSMIPKKLVFGISDPGIYRYWLASRGARAWSDYAYFGPGAVLYGRADSCGEVFGSNGYSNFNELSLRAVVSLRSEIPAGGEVLVNSSEWDIGGGPK